MDEIYAHTCVSACVSCPHKEIYSLVRLTDLKLRRLVKWKNAFVLSASEMTT